MLFKNVLKSLIVASIASETIASPVAHLHHAHKRDVVQVTETVIITVGGANTDLAQAPAATQTTIDQQTDGTQTAYAYQVTVAATSSSADVKAFETQALSAADSTATATAQAATVNSGFSGSSKGITYSPYNADGTCKDLSAVKADLAKLSQFSLIRLYGVDCNQVENVMQAKHAGQKLFLGIFFMDQIAAGISQLSNAVKTYGSWDDVYTVSIGNELVNSGAASPAQIGSYIATGRSLLTAAGYNGPVVSVDTHVAIINNPELCQYSDYIAFNAHAYWDGTVTGSDAGPWLLLQMQRVWSACGGKNVLCTESGWPHSGQNNGVAVASPSEASAAISSIGSTCGSDTIVFNAFDDLWKNPGAKGVEQFWGVY
jgi:exo-beta-1,3-glucanase (GH17 family)